MCKDKRNRLNIGCGMSPTPGWRNLDNSLSVRLSKYVGSSVLLKMKLIDTPSLRYIEFCKLHNIKWANASKRIPADSGEVEVIYSSHMLEHMDRFEAALFLREAHRVLRPGGIIRIVVPDIILESDGPSRRTVGFESEVSVVNNSRIHGMPVGKVQEY